MRLISINFPDPIDEGIPDTAGTAAQRSYFLTAASEGYPRLGGADAPDAPVNNAKPNLSTIIVYRFSDLAIVDYIRI